jgi:hypothetical protein
LLADDNGGKNSAFLFRSMFTGYNGAIGFGMGKRLNKDNKVIGGYFLNVPLRQLVQISNDPIMNISDHRILLDVKNSDAFTMDNTSNYYCYDLSIPPMPEDSFDLNKYLKEDLKRIFNITVKKETRSIKCLVFKATEKLAGLPSSSKKSEADILRNSIKKYFHHHTVAEILNNLEFHFDKPAIDETGVEKPIDIEFPANFNLSDTTELLKFLKSLGFSISEEKRELDVVIISDK